MSGLDAGARSYAAAAAANRPTQRGNRVAAAINPLRHLSHLQGLSLLVDLKSVRPNNTRVERADFVLKDLEVPAEEVLSIFVDHATQLLVLTVESEVVFDAALERLHAGVPWAAADDAPVFGSSSNDAVSSVRVSNIPPGLPIASVLSHMQQFGIILSHNIGKDRLFPRARDGILHLTMVINEVDSLPHFVQVVDRDGRLSNSLPVHLDSPRRCCYRCGRPTHLGYRCQATTRAPEALASIWSTMVAPPAPSLTPTVPQPLPQAPGLQTGPQTAAEAAATETTASTTSPPPPSTSTSAPPTPIKRPDSNNKAVVDLSLKSPAVPVASALGGQKRPLASSLPPTSSSSERERSRSPPHPDGDFTLTGRSRKGKRNRRNEIASAVEAAKAQGVMSRVPLAVPQPPPSALEDEVLTPAVMEVSEAEEKDGGGG